MTTLGKLGTDIQHQSTLWQWTQIAIAYSAIEVCLWTQGDTQRICSLFAAGLVIALTAIEKRPAAELGLTLAGLGRSLVAVPLALLVAAGMYLAAGELGTLHAAHPHLSALRGMIGYGIWAMMQEFLLQSFFFVRFESLLGSGQRAVWAAAALFAAAHFPNPVLMIATLLSGLLLCEIFRRFRNVYALGVAHTIMGVTLAVSVPDALLRHMRVGIAYWTFHLIR